jgi:hypothetical protein
MSHGGSIVSSGGENNSSIKLRFTELDRIQSQLADTLLAQADPLFALLDGARDPKVHDCLKSCPEEYCSLYDGDELADVAPYLVRLGGSDFLTWLAKNGWGQSWGIYLCSRVSLVELREHFRRLLMAETEDRKRYYFRFYDPRVLRVFLPSCTQEEIRQFLGPVSQVLFEGEVPELLVQFESSEKGIRHKDLHLVQSEERS